MNNGKYTVGWKCRRCGQVVDMVAFRCGCTESPSPWEPIYDEQFPSEQGPLLVEVIYQKDFPDVPPMLIGVHGQADAALLTELEEQIQKDVAGGETEYYSFEEGSGRYLYSVHYISPQYGDEGRIELPSYWEFILVKYKPFETIPWFEDMP